MKLVVILLAAFLSTSVFAGGKVIGNGGDSRALDFYDYAQRSIKAIKSNANLYPEVKDIDLQTILDKTEILISEVPLYSVKGEVRQFSTAINYKDPDTIVVYGPRWNDLKNNAIKLSLALHEVLSLAGVEETGVYTVSQRYLSENGIACDSGLCENLPRYNCTFSKMPFSTNIIEYVGTQKIGYTLTTNEIVDIHSGEMKATIVMNTTAASGHVMIVLYQNGRTVGISEMQGFNFPPFLQLKWKDVLANVAWTVSCQQN